MEVPQFESTRSVWRTLSVWLCALMLVTSLGCQFAPKDKPFKWPWKKDKTKPLPDRILPVWTESVLHQPNQPGVRGFGGRIYFYAKDNTDPMEIDGSLAIYVFDADDIEVSSQKPLRKFVFTADQFSSHMSKTSIGPSYSIWLPWGEVGGPPRRLSLIARFEGREGGTAISDPTIKLLPGVPSNVQSQDPLAAEKPNAAANPFHLSGHQRKQGSKSKGLEQSEAEKLVPGREIKTIDLPPSFQRHLRGTTREINQTSAPQSTSPNGQPNPDTSLNAVPGSTDPAAVETTGESASDSNHLLPVTTQVYDYRTRQRQGAAGMGPAKNNIRQGRWIESVTRD